MVAGPRVWPAPLAPGAVVRVVAPAGPVDPGRLRAGSEMITSWGLTVQLAQHALDTDERLPYLSAPDEVRAADLAAAWTDPEVDAVWAARGGYGTQRMLDLVDWDALRAEGPKHLIGFSDVTALHGRLGRELGQVTLHGPGVTALGQLRDEETSISLRRLLTEPPMSAQLLAAGRTVLPGVAEGRLWGGNLRLLASEVGVEPPPGDVVLVLEDVAEPDYRLDRALTQLRRAGWLDGVRGVLVGDLGVPPSDETVPTVVDRLGDRGAPMGSTPRSVTAPATSRCRSAPAYGSTPTAARAG